MARWCVHTLELHWGFMFLSPTKHQRAPLCKQTSATKKPELRFGVPLTLWHPTLASLKSHITPPWRGSSYARTHKTHKQLKPVPGLSHAHQKELVRNRLSDSSTPQETEEVRGHQGRSHQVFAATDLLPGTCTAESVRNDGGTPRHTAGTSRVKRREAPAFVGLPKTSPSIFPSKTSSTVSFLKKLGVYWFKLQTVITKEILF